MNGAGRGPVERRRLVDVYMITASLRPGGGGLQATVKELEGKIEAANSMYNEERARMAQEGLSKKAALQEKEGLASLLRRERENAAARQEELERTVR
eukprot:1144459-Prorocentrum_minimum.AAC.2